jgi:hypothetical protein
MNKREIARQFSLDTVIYDPELSTKAAKALSADMIEVSPEQRFDMDIVFDRHVYQNADFYRFPLIKESLHTLLQYQHLYSDHRYVLFSIVNGGSVPFSILQWCNAINFSKKLDIVRLVIISHTFTQFCNLYI